MPQCITYINFTMDSVNDATGELYESLFESDEEIIKSIDDMIELLKKIKEPYLK